MNYCVYKLEYKSGACYIGITKNLKQRILSHKYAPCNANLINEIESNGNDCFDCSVLASGVSKEDAKKIESEYIIEYSSRCLNVMKLPKETIKEEISHIIFKINEDLKHSFKKACLNNKETQTDAMNRLVRYYIDTKGKLKDK
jgi:hypothetical protein